MRPAGLSLKLRVQLAKGGSLGCLNNLSMRRIDIQNEFMHTSILIRVGHIRDVGALSERTESDQAIEEY